MIRLSVKYCISGIKAGPNTYWNCMWVVVQCLLVFVVYIYVHVHVHVHGHEAEMITRRQTKSGRIERGLADELNF